MFLKYFPSHTCKLQENAHELRDVPPVLPDSSDVQNPIALDSQPHQGLSDDLKCTNRKNLDHMAPRIPT